MATLSNIHAWDLRLGDTYVRHSPVTGELSPVEVVTLQLIGTEDVLINDDLSIGRRGKVLVLRRDTLPDRG